ncbi:hypothetical protein NC651_005517 [Populus alba x Populus x berolinensis]|nr:hypothetical protein NC651_005517 [Populus alba x Populus x berolinensis]
MIVHPLELRCTYNTDCEREKQQEEADTTTSSEI